MTPVKLPSIFDGVTKQAYPPDGPLVPPDEIREPSYPDDYCGPTAYPADISREDYRKVLAAELEDHKQRARAYMSGVSKTMPLDSIGPILPEPKPIDMNLLVGRVSDEKIKELIERWYFWPGSDGCLGSMDHMKKEWDVNAAGIYYRHHHSHHWEESGHHLWIPTVDDLDWNDPTESMRRERAAVFFKHNLQNESWHKSEYAWEADAWTDVWGLMRNDPVLVANKHDYYTTIEGNHPMTCLLNGEQKRVHRTPDATFGLATFKPEHYQRPWANYELDRDRLQALMVHPDLAIVSDPKLGDPDLAFPFAVFEAKGWSGDARDARHQACAAGVAYLDLIDALARVPRNRRDPRSRVVEYQPQSAPARQIFAFTSFGSYWHVLVGYRRPRSKAEHSVVAGVSKNVYIFQRLWSGRVIDERTAWELFSLVDQIHQWGVTVYRDCVTELLKGWHHLCFQEYVSNTSTLSLLSPPDLTIICRLGVDEVMVHLPEVHWLVYLGPAKRRRVRALQCLYYWDAFLEHFRPHSAAYIHDAVRQRDRLSGIVVLLSRRNMKSDGEDRDSRITRLKTQVEGGQGGKAGPKPAQTALALRPTTSAVPQQNIGEPTVPSPGNKRPGDSALRRSTRASKRHKGKESEGRL